MSRLTKKLAEDPAFFGAYAACMQLNDSDEPIFRFRIYDPKKRTRIEGIHYQAATQALGEAMLRRNYGQHIEITLEDTITFKKIEP